MIVIQMYYFQNAVLAHFSIPAYPAEHHIQYYANLLIKHPRAVISLVSPFVSGCITLHFYQMLKLVFWELLLFKLFYFSFQTVHFHQLSAYLPVYHSTVCEANVIVIIFVYWSCHLQHESEVLFFFFLVFILLLSFWLCSKLALTFVKG